MGLNIIRETFGSPEDHSWLGSAHGTQETDSITLDKTTCFATFGRVVPSGAALGLITATGKYGPYVAGATDGRAVVAGALYTTKDLGGDLVGTASDCSAALLWHGEIIVANLPASHGWTTTARAAIPLIRFA